MLEVRNVVKHFGKFTALHGVSFTVPRGELFGLLGHNGAGKSTIFGTTLGQVHPTSGEVLIDGISVQSRRAQALRKVGAIFETPAFWEYLSGWENLRILASMSGVSSEAPLREALEIVGLGNAIKKRVAEYSHGMRQRLALAQALTPRPDLLLLDEPTDGLDPVGIVETRDLLTRLNRELGLTIVLSSHLLGEIEHLCDRVAIIRQGRLVFEGRWREAPGQNQRLSLRIDKPGMDRSEFLRHLGARIMSLGPEPDALQVELPEHLSPADLNETLVKAGFRVHQLSPVQIGLEELYRELNISQTTPVAEAHAA